MLPEPHLLSMSAGDMVEVYSHPQRTAAYDFVLTCFFIDTSHNIIEYIEVIHNALKVAPASSLPLCPQNCCTFVSVFPEQV